MRTPASGVEVPTNGIISFRGTGGGTDASSKQGPRGAGMRTPASEADESLAWDGDLHSNQGV
jgi:hypothetical protein